MHTCAPLRTSFALHRCVCAGIGQIHTPDSSRYWLSDSYESRLAAGQEPQNIDKEFLRLWFRACCDPYKDKVGEESAAACNQLHETGSKLFSISTVQYRC